MAELIAENDDIAVFFSPGRGDRCMFVMGHMLNHTRSQYWAQIPIEALQLPCVGVAAKRPHWYPPSVMAGASPLIKRTIAGFARRIGYGYSMGAFGILAYGREIGLTDALAFSPQWSISPEYVAGIDDRYREFFRPLLNVGHKAEVDREINSAIIYDPTMPIDLWNAAQIDRQHHATHVHIKGVGHHTAETMIATSRLEILLNRAQDYDYAGMKQDFSKWKRDVLFYRSQVAARLIRRGDVALASKLIEQILAKDGRQNLARQLSALLT